MRSLSVEPHGLLGAGSLGTPEGGCIGLERWRRHWGGRDYLGLGSITSDDVVMEGLTGKWIVWDILLMNSEPLRLVSSSGRPVRLTCCMPNS